MADSVKPSAGMIEVGPGVYAPASALRFSYARSSGPGGQNVNKVNTKVEMWIRPDLLLGLNLRAIDRLGKLAGRRLTGEGEIHLSADTERGQEGNRSEAFRRLREMIVQAKVEPKVRRKRKPSKAAKARRLEGKRRRSEVKSTRGNPRDV